MSFSVIIKPLSVLYILKIPKSAVEPMGSPWKEEGDSYVITVYFKDPSLICFDKHDLNAKYIGDRLLIQNGSKSHGFVQVPLLERGLSGGEWTEGECFWSMGERLSCMLLFVCLFIF